MATNSALGLNGFTFARGVAFLNTFPVPHLQSFKINTEQENIEIKKGEINGKYIFPTDRTYKLTLEFAGGAQPKILEALFAASSAYSDGKDENYQQLTMTAIETSASSFATTDTCYSTAGTNDILFSGTITNMQIRGFDTKKLYLAFSNISTAASYSSVCACHWYSTGADTRIRFLVSNDVSWFSSTESSNKFDVYGIEDTTTGVTLTVNPDGMPSAMDIILTGSLLDPAAENEGTTYDKIVVQANNCTQISGFEFGAGKDASNMTVEFNIPNDSSGDFIIAFPD